LKRALTDRAYSAASGNAYSDEILFSRSVVSNALTQKLTTEQVERLFAAINTTLNDWLERLRAKCRRCLQLPTQNASIAPQLASPKR